MKTPLNISFIPSFFPISVNPSLVTQRFFLLFFLFSLTANLSANAIDKIDNIPLAGAYTIGGNMPDFITIQAAVDSLTACGVNGAVVFNIRDGVYEEQLFIREVVGASENNTITFQSESGDSTAVVWTFLSISSAQNYTVMLYGADWMRFIGLTIEARGETYGRAIDIRAGAEHNVFKNNRLKSVATTISSLYSTIIYSPEESVDSYNQFVQNTFLNGSRGIAFIDRSKDYTYGTVIEKNTFKNQASTALYLRQHNAAQVIANSFYSDVNNAQSISLNDCNYGTNIIDNKIVLRKGTGIYLDNNQGSEMQPIIIANNFISITDKLDLWQGGLLSISSSYQYFFYNTVQVTIDEGNYGAFNSLWGGNEKIHNNIFANFGEGYAIHLETPFSLKSDFNNLFTTGANIGLVGSLELVTLMDWQEAINTDINSLSLNPLFTTPAHYQINQVGLYNKGTPLTEISKDIEGATRNNQTPDIGVLEWTIDSLNIAPIAIINPIIPFQTSNESVDLVIKNKGLITIEQVAIHWAINETIQPTYLWNGQLKSGATDTFSIGTADFLPIFPNTLKIWTSQPNDSVDPIVEDDTLQVNELITGLAGTYTIGGVSPDFIDFEEAAKFLNRGGVLEAVTFKIRDGVYQEQITLQEIIGVDSLNSVIFESESEDSTSVILNEQINVDAELNYILKLDGTDWITFKGLTFETIEDTLASLVIFDNSATKNTFSHNRFQSSVDNVRGLVYDNSNTKNDYNSIINNSFLNGRDALYISNRGSFEDKSKGINISNNLFEGFTRQGIALIGQVDMLLANNIIRGNNIKSIESFYGVYLGGCYRGKIINNDIEIQNGVAGLYIEGTTSDFYKKTLYANNVIKMTGSNSLNELYGIYISSGERQQFSHNSISITSPSPNSAAFFTAYSSELSVLNNIFVNFGEGYAYYYEHYNSSFGGVVDYNNLYSTGNNLGYWLSNKTSLEEWKSNSWNRSSSSINVDPYFKDKEHDLHVENPLLNKAGTQLTKYGSTNTVVSKDIDGMLRDPIQPDIGADEFLYPSIDASISTILLPEKPFASGIHSPKITLVNLGSDTLKEVEIHWAANGQKQLPFKWTGILLSGKQKDSLSIGSFDFKVDTSYTITAWTALPNGVVDTLTYNDTITSSPVYAALHGIYTIGGLNPDFQNFNSAITTMKAGGITDNVIFNIRSGTYDEQLRISSILGANEQQTITFQSETKDSSQVILRPTAISFNDNYVVELDYADWIRFQHITFINESFYGRIITLNYAATNNYFGNNAFIGSVINSFSNQHALVHSEIWNNDANVFKNNYFFGGNYGIHLKGTDSFTFGVEEAEMLVENNEFANQYYRGIYLEGMQHRAIIKNNRIRSNSNGYVAGIGLFSILHPVKIIGNHITCSGGSGIHLNNVFSSSPKPNIKGLIANNFIEIETQALSGGIGLNYTHHQNIYFNTVKISGYASASRAVNLVATSNITMKNNIFSSVDNGYALYCDYEYPDSDYNVFYSANNFLVNWRNQEITTIQALQSLSGNELNAINHLPKFLSETDLHLKDSLINGKGIPLPEITTDIDGDQRDPNNPDIGADEFDFFKNDLGIIAILSPTDSCNLSQIEPIKVLIENLGREAQSDFQIGYQLANGNTILETTIDLIIEPGDTAMYTFNTPINLSDHQTYALTCFTALSTDSKLANDSLTMLIKNHRSPAMIDNTLPLDGATNLNLPIDFSWLPAIDADRYDLFLWKNTDIPSTVPIIRDVTTNYYLYPDNDLQHGGMYNWQIIAKNDFCETAGQVRSFTIKGLPNLAIKNMEILFSPIMDKPIEVNWTVENTGGSTNGSQWYDFVYLSESENFDQETATYLGGFPNAKALNEGEMYTQKQALDLPTSTLGQYYIFVVTDIFNRVEELADEDNTTAAFSICKSIQKKKEVILNLATEGPTEITPTEMIEAIPVNCEIPIVWLNQTTFDCAAIGLNQLLLYVQDQAGAIDSVAVSLMITDESIACNECQETDLLIESTTLSSGAFVVEQNISTAGKVSKDTLVILRAGNTIHLLPGFHAEKASSFTAQIMDCEWAIAEGINEVDAATKKIGFASLEKTGKPTSISLKVSPNPFKESTNIQFNLAEATSVNLQLYDVNGRLLKILIQNSYYEIGSHQLTFTNTNYVPNVYFLVLRTEQTQMVHKLMLIR